SEGTRLTEVALRKLLAEEAALEAQGQARSARAAVALLMRGCVLGLHQALPRLIELVARHARQDAQLPSLAQAAGVLQQLLGSSALQEHLQTPSLGPLQHLLWQQALLQLPTLAGAAEAAEPELIDALLALRGVWQHQAAPDALWLDHLHELARQPEVAPGIAAACTALLSLDQQGSATALLAEQLQRHFGVGADPLDAVRYLRGLLRVSPALLLGQPALLQALDACLARWEDSEFLRYLPELRQAFTYLKPFETERIARQVAAQHDSQLDLSIGHEHFTAEEVQLGLQVDQQLGALLERAGWLGAPTHD
ncbi:MAG: hypothetical protein KDI56_17890, partial [Xanthomonadales bacterium]|nr:hypothetical protein [Xanthomonadales bacterium]